MKPKIELLDQIHHLGGKAVAVTKYLSPTDTQAVLPALLAHPAVCGLGENRAEGLLDKQLPRAQTHFIGRLQSRKLPEIVQHCAFVHSLDQWSHAQKISQLASDNNLLIKIFVQVNISQEAQKGGIDPEELPMFLEKVVKLRSCEVIGLSGMGSLFKTEMRNEKCEIIRKQSEFECLKKLRDEYLPEGLLSAGTSSDYKIALESGVDIVRIGRALF